MIFTNYVYLKNVILCVTNKPKHSCILVLADHLWLPFFDQPQSDIVVFAIYFLDI